MINKLYINHTLKTLTDEYVKILEIDDDSIVVEYKGKEYTRKKSIIGNKLFIIKEDLKVEEYEVKRSCDSCFYLKNESCFGRSNICEDYKHVVSISKEEAARWPKFGDATYYRMISKKR